MSRQCDCSFSSALASSLLPPLFFAPRSPRSFVLVKVLSLTCTHMERQAVQSMFYTSQHKDCTGE